MKKRISEIPIVSNSQPTKQSALTAAEIEALADDPDGVRRLCKRALIEIVGNSARTTAITPVIRELMDRTDGKAPQAITSVNITATVDSNYGLPEHMRIEMMRHKVRLWDEQQAKTIENDDTLPM